MKPVVVLVGRPNVGKSTLFNVLTRSRAAIVADSPGVTRDRQFGDGRIGDRPYLVVDTGGMMSRTASDISRLMNLQTQQALDEADALILVVDARDGVTGEDREIADRLRRHGLRVTVAVNKSEGMEPAAAAAEFHALGLGESVAISSAHDRGVDTLMDKVLAPLPDVAELEAPDTGVPTIAIAGRPNVGKSTLANAMLGEQRVVVADAPGTTRDSIRIPIVHRGRDYVLVDTAGVRRRGRVVDPIEKVSVIKTLQAVDESNVVILVLDARQEVSDQDVDLAGYVLEQGRSLVLAINKWDHLDQADRDQIKRAIDRKLSFLSFAPPHFISALEHTGIDRLFKAVDSAYQSARVEMATARLNRILERAVQATPPPIVRGRRPKLKFAHQSGHNPPQVTVHGNSVGKLADSYRRYLESAFRKAFGLEGTPVRVVWQQGENPYAEPKSVKKASPRKSAMARRERRIRKTRQSRSGNK